MKNIRPPRFQSPTGRDFAYAAEAALLSLLVGMFWLLPIDAASALGGFLARLIGPYLAVSKRALKNLTRAFPDNSQQRNREILQGMWDNLGRTAAEYPHLRRICAADSGRIEVINGEAVSALAHDGRPGILVGGHFCNWEVGPYILRRLLGLPLASVYRAPNNPWVDRLIRRMRQASIEIPKGGDGSRELLRILKRGGHAALLVDQKLNDGISVPFFGHDAMTAPGVARLALRLDCPVVPIVGERLRGAHFRMIACPPVEIKATGDMENDVLRIMSSINSILEEWIRKKPEQWLWVHRRWQD